MARRKADPGMEGGCDGLMLAADSLAGSGQWDWGLR